MENKTVGWLILGISFVIVGIILLFNQAMVSIVDQGCPVEHTTGVCPAYNTIQDQTYLSFAIVAVLVLVGVVLLFSKPSERIVVKHIKDKPRQHTIDTSDFSPDEKRVYTILVKERALLQADLTEISGLAKVKVTRVLDKLESRGLVERKRRGMHNLVVFR